MRHKEFLRIERPSYERTIKFMQGSNLQQTKTVYYINPLFENDHEADVIFNCMHRTHGSYLHGFLLGVGLYATLWVGDLDGIIAPMDFPPSGWTYPSGRPVESSWFWEWVPSEFSKFKLLEDLKQTNPLASKQSRLKSLVPLHLNDKFGNIMAVDAIPVVSLPGLFVKDVWTFEIESV